MSWENMDEFTQVGGLGDYDGAEKGVVYRNADEDYVFFESPLLMRMADGVLESEISPSPDAESDRIQHLLEAAELDLEGVKVGANNNGDQSYLGTQIEVNNKEIEHVDPGTAVAYSINSEAEFDVDNRLLRSRSELETEIEGALKFYGLEDRKWADVSEKPGVNPVHRLANPEDFLMGSPYKGRSTRSIGVAENEPGLQGMEINVPEKDVFVPDGGGNQAAIKKKPVSDSGRYTDLTGSIRHKDLGTLPVALIDEFGLEPDLYIEFDRVSGLEPKEGEAFDSEIVTPAIGYLVFGDVFEEDHEVVQLSDSRVEDGQELYSHGIRGYIPVIGSERPVKFTINDTESRDKFVEEYREQNGIGYFDTIEPEEKVSSFSSDTEDKDDIDYIQ